MKKVTVRANPNIAFIKYWGNKNSDLRIPVNSSISMNLDGLYTETSVRFDKTLTSDSLILNGEKAGHEALQRVVHHLDMMRDRLGFSGYLTVESQNNFPTGAGIASSASAFSALTLAVSHIADIELTEAELSSLARIGSGSASRSIPSGFVEWYEGEDHESSYAETFIPIDHWDIVDVIAVISSHHKAVGSKRGHETANSSDLQDARVNGANDRLSRCKQSIQDRDFATFAEVVELDSNLMHSVMITSNPPLFYWHPASLEIMQKVREWRSEGINVCYTLDAGPNVHCICERKYADAVVNNLKQIAGIQELRIAGAGDGARIIQETD